VAAGTFVRFTIHCVVFGPVEANFAVLVVDVDTLEISVSEAVWAAWEAFGAIDGCKQGTASVGAVGARGAICARVQREGTHIRAVIHTRDTILLQVSLVEALLGCVVQLSVSVAVTPS